MDFEQGYETVEMMIMTMKQVLNHREEMENKLEAKLFA
jgi:hypothetical protein